MLFSPLILCPFSSVSACTRRMRTQQKKRVSLPKQVIKPMLNPRRGVATNRAPIAHSPGSVSGIGPTRRLRRAHHFGDLNRGRKIVDINIQQPVYHRRRYARQMTRRFSVPKRRRRSAGSFWLTSQSKLRSAESCNARLLQRLRCSATHHRSSLPAASHFRWQNG